MNELLHIARNIASNVCATHNGIVGGHSIQFINLIKKKFQLEFRRGAHFTVPNENNTNENNLQYVIVTRKIKFQKVEKKKIKNNMLIWR